MRKQLRAHLEMEQLFGNSDISYRREFVKTLPRISLLILLSKQSIDLEENQLLNRMLKTLELPAEEFIISDLSQEGPESLIKKHRPKCIFTMGQVSKSLGIEDFSEEFSFSFNQIPVVSSFSARHLIDYPEDKRHSWQCLLIIKSLLKS
jgi:hypothetical protein